MNRTKIDWPWKPLYTWNPVVGCKRGCSWCYAKDLHEKRHRAYKEGKLQNLKQYAKPFEEIQSFEERLQEPYKLKKPASIFVGSMSGIEYWGREDFYNIRNVCAENERHTFLFLTKNPEAYMERLFPRNCIIGITITLEEKEESITQKLAKHLLCHKRGFISIEPLLGQIKTPKIGEIDISKYTSMERVEKVIVGAMTGKNAVKPKPEWIQSIKDNIPENKIYWKNNIRKYL